MNLSELAKNFSREEAAIKYLESKLWPNGPACPHCGLLNEAFEMKSKAETKNKMRPGLWKCSGCRKTFRVTVGTIFEDSHIPLHKWIMAIHLMCASKKGISAHQMHRMLGLGYRAAWFMCHRIRYAMTEETLLPKLSGTVEVDEAFIGGKFRAVPKAKPGERPQDRKSPIENKTPVVSMVERSLVKSEEGKELFKSRVRSRIVERVTAENLKPILNEHIESGTTLNTDEATVYLAVKPDFPDHRVVDASDEGIRSGSGRKADYDKYGRGIFRDSKAWSVWDVSPHRERASPSVP